MNDKALVARGSLRDVALFGDTGLAMMDAKIVLICDRSGSMEQHDAMNGKARYEVEDGVIADLQAKYPGQIVLEAFADFAIFCENGILPAANGASTMMANAFDAASKLAKLGMAAILITDGEASDMNEDDIIRAALPFKGKLDIIFIGTDHAPGAKFLKRLAKETAGGYNSNDLKSNPAALKGVIEKRLLLSAGK
jgi:hypothetical protein